MINEEIERCRSIMTETNRILRELNKNGIEGAVNWGDLSCRSVSKVESFCGGNDIVTEWHVSIEEASPDAWKFQAAVAAELEKCGYPAIVVITEW